MYQVFSRYTYCMNEDGSDSKIILMGRAWVNLRHSLNKLYPVISLNGPHTGMSDSFRLGWIQSNRLDSVWMFNPLPLFNSSNISFLKLFSLYVCTELKHSGNMQGNKILGSNMNSDYKKPVCQNYLCGMGWKCLLTISTPSCLFNYYWPHLLSFLHFNPRLEVGLKLILSQSSQTHTSYE